MAPRAVRTVTRVAYVIKIKKKKNRVLTQVSHSFRLHHFRLRAVRAWPSAIECCRGICGSISSVLRPKKSQTTSISFLITCSAGDAPEFSICDCARNRRRCVENGIKVRRWWIRRETLGFFLHFWLFVHSFLVQVPVQHRRFNVIIFI